MELAATRAREIDKAKVIEPELVSINGQFVGERADDAMKPGDFYVSPQEERRIVPVEPPARLLPRVWWRFFGAKEKEQVKVHERVILSCPCCGLPILLNPAYIEATAPLTIATAVECPYAPKALSAPHSFEIKDGNITST